MVSVSNEAVRVEGSAIYLKPGQKVKLEDLVYGLMLDLVMTRASNC